jgi:RNA 3'-terminal phosphate cyclase (ATP)
MKSTQAALTIDGSIGEGGGQVLRTALAGSLVTGTPFRIEKIRAGRQRPGLMRQHLAAVRAAVEVSGAAAAGADVGSQELTFRPGPVRAGKFAWKIGSAGSTTLVLETVLPALALAGAPSTLEIEGGTHNPLAPPFDFVARAWLPLLERMGVKVRARLERPGFYPAGGGRIAVEIEPAPAFRPIELAERGEIFDRRATARVAALSGDIAKRELAVVEKRLGWERSWLQIEQLDDAFGPGNVLVIEVASQHVREVFTGFGEKGVSAEEVARVASDAVREYLAAGVPVGEHLADQLLLPLALARGGRLRTLPLSSHAKTAIEIIRMFFPDVAFLVTPAGDRKVDVILKKA